MAENKNLMPKRRFKEFQSSHAWVQRKLGEVTRSYSGGTPSVGKAEYYNGHIPFIRSAEINSDTTELFLSECGLMNSSAKMVYTEDILYALYGATSGEVGIAQIEGAINQAILAIKPNHGYDSQFLMQWLRGQKQKIIDKYLQGGQGNLSGAIVKDLLAHFPNHEEQQQIGAYFKQLDRLITLHQRKLEKTKALKAAFLSEMFPQEGECEPKRRFAGFTGAWEQRKLGDVIEGLYNGQTPSRFQGEFWNGNINWLTSGELNLSVVKTTNERITLAGQKNANLRLIPKGTFVMAITGLEAAGTRGNCGILGIDTTLNQSCMAIFPNKKIMNTQFLFQWYKMVGEDYGIRFTQGTKQQSYNAEILKSLEICLPQIEEQQKIGLLFQQLDNFITVQQLKLEKLQAIKKAYLNEMFV